MEVKCTFWLREVSVLHCICLDMETFSIHPTWEIKRKVVKTPTHIIWFIVLIQQGWKSSLFKSRPIKCAINRQEIRELRSCVLLPDVTQIVQGPPISRESGSKGKPFRVNPELNSENILVGAGRAYGPFYWHFWSVFCVTPSTTNRKSLSETVPHNEVGTVVIITLCCCCSDEKANTEQFTNLINVTEVARASRSQNRTLGSLVPVSWLFTMRLCRLFLIGHTWKLKTMPSTKTVFPIEEPFIGTTC